MNPRRPSRLASARMPIQRKMVVGIGSALLLAGLVVLFMISSVPTRVPSLSLGLIGFTNSPDQEQQAVFAIRNPNPRMIFCKYARPQVRTNGHWPQELEWLPSRRIQFTLKANAMTNITVLVPNGRGPWRLPVVWGFVPGRWDRIKTIARENWEALRGGGELPGTDVLLDLSAEMAYSSTITN